MISVSVRKKYQSSLIDINFETDEPGITAIFGRSGAGKTSLIDMIAGITRPDQGFIKIDDQVLFDSAADISLKPELRNIGYVFQDARLFPHMTVKKNLLFGWNHRETGLRRIDLEDVVDVLGLDKLLERSPVRLSGGEAQRVQFGRAILSNPKLLLMDEPLSSLDHQHRQEILPFIERLRDEFKIPILYVSHAMDEIIRLADKLLILENGRVAADGGVEELTGRLDLRPLTGRYEAGSVISAVIVEHDRDYAISHLEFPGGVLRVPLMEGDPGTQVRIRIRARDVSVSKTAPSDVSELNIFPAKIVEIASPSANDLPHCDTLIDIGVPLWVRLTRLSIKNLDLKPGDEAFALIKGTSVDRQNLAIRKGQDHA
ncbi:MAG: molybdenum ABC transporter ATP-binding protein [Rhodospirillaceae bacterium]